MDWLNPETWNLNLKKWKMNIRYVALITVTHSQSIRDESKINFLEINISWLYIYTQLVFFYTWQGMNCFTSWTLILFEDEWV